MQSMKRLLQPRTIAVIGGGNWCENVVRECCKLGFTGEIWPIHPTRTAIGGKKAVKSLSELENAPDASFVGVNRNSTIEIVRELSRMGAGGAVCFAAGFSEAQSGLSDGTELQGKLVAAAGNMPFLGPNCYGFINAVDRVALWPDQHGLKSVSKGVAIITQSSNIALNLTMQLRGLPIAYLVTVGNQAQTGLSAIAMNLLKDERVTALGLHIEGIDNLREFEQLTKLAWDMGKGLVAIKMGRSEAAKSAVISHTASITGTATGSSALFKRLGVAEVTSLSTFLEALKFLHVTKGLDSNRIVSMSCSGGEASLIADTVENSNLCFPILSAGQKDRLREILGGEVACVNPLDYHTRIWGDIEAMSSTFAIMLEGDIGLGIVVLDFPREHCDISEWNKVIEAIEIAIGSTGKQMAVLSTLTDTMPEEIAMDLMTRGIIPLAGMNESIEAVDAIAKLANHQHSAPIHIPQMSGSIVTLNEHDAKSKLEQFGIKTPNRIVVGNASKATAAVEKVGFPVVLKANGIAHKSESGAVALNLRTKDAVAAAVESIATDEILVEEMITGGVAELLVGIVRDDSCGCILTIGAGGILTELQNDCISMLVPAGRREIEHSLKKLKMAPILSGYRGKPAVDVGSIVDAVMAVQEYAMSGPVEEVEINPLLCGPKFAIAVDALIRCGEDYA